MTKTCSLCAQTKPVEAFHRDRRLVGGRNARCAECIREKNRAYRSRPGVTRRDNLRRRLGSDEAAEYADILLSDPCCYCGSPASELDHIVPTSAGGAKGWDNLTASCRLCNGSKRTQPLLLALAQRRGYFQEVPPTSFVVLKDRACA